MTRERVRNYALILITGALMALTLSTVSRVRSPATSGALTPDFLAHWTGGRALAEGLAGHLYDPAVQQAVQNSAVAPGLELSWFVSPPFVAALYVPFSLMPYGAAAMTWTIISVGMLAWSLSKLGHFGPQFWLPNNRLVLLVVAASYPVFELLAAGQDSALTLAIWLLGASLAIRSKEAAAGFVFSLGLIKPQLVWIVPLLFLVQRRYTALATFFLGGLVAGSVSVVLTGVDGVRAWLSLLASPLYLEGISTAQDWKMGSVSSLAKALAGSAGLPFANAVGYATAILFAAVFLTWTVRRSPDPQALWPAALITSLAASPHLFLYDLLLLAPVAVFALDRGGLHARAWVAAAFVLSWLMPSLHLLSSHLIWPLSLVSAPWVGVTVCALWVIVLRCPSMSADLKLPAGTMPTSGAPTSGRVFPA